MRSTDNPTSGDVDARRSGPSAAAASAYNDPTWPDPQKSPEAPGTSRAAYSLPCSGKSRRRSHEEAVGHRLQRQRDLPQCARVTTAERARKCTFQEESSHDHGSGMTYTFCSASFKEERSVDTKQSQAKIAEVSCLNANSSRNESAVARSSVDERRSVHLGTATANVVPKMLGNLVAALFRWRRSGLNTTQINEGATRASDDERLLNAGHQQAGAYPSTMQLWGETEEIACENITNLRYKHEREPVGKSYALEAGSKDGAVSDSFTTNDCLDTSKEGVGEKGPTRLPHEGRYEKLVALAHVSDLQCQHTKLSLPVRLGDECYATVTSPSPLLLRVEPSLREPLNAGPDNDDQDAVVARALLVTPPPGRLHAVPRGTPERSGYTEEWEPRCSAEAFARSSRLKAVVCSEPSTPQSPALALASATLAAPFNFQEQWCHSTEFVEPFQVVAGAAGTHTHDTSLDTAVSELQKPSSNISRATCSAQTGNSITYLSMREVTETKCADTQTSEAWITCPKRALKENAGMHWTEVHAPIVAQSTDRSQSLPTSKSLSDASRSAPARSSIAPMQEVGFFAESQYAPPSGKRASEKSAHKTDPSARCKNAPEEGALTDSTGVSKPHILTETISLSSGRFAFSSPLKGSSGFESRQSSMVKALSCPMLKKRTVKTCTAANSSKGVQFPWGLINTHDIVDMCLCPSAFIGRLFINNRAISSPAIPKNTFVDNARNKGKEPALAEKPVTTTSAKKTLQEPEIGRPSSTTSNNLQKATAAASAVGVTAVDVSETTQSQPHTVVSQRLVTHLTNSSKTEQRSSRTAESEHPVCNAKVRPVPITIRTVPHDVSTEQPRISEPRRNSADVATMVIPAGHASSQSELRKLAEDLPAIASSKDALHGHGTRQRNFAVTKELQRTERMSPVEAGPPQSRSTPTRPFSLSSRCLIVASSDHEKESVGERSLTVEGKSTTDIFKGHSLPFVFKVLHADTSAVSPCKTFSRKKSDVATTITAVGDLANVGDAQIGISSAISAKDAFREAEVRQQNAVPCNSEQREAAGLPRTSEPCCSTESSRFSVSSQRAIATGIKSKFLKVNSSSAAGEPPERNIKVRSAPFIGVIVSLNGSPTEVNESNREVEVKGNPSELRKAREARGIHSDAVKNETSEKLPSHGTFVVPVCPRKFLSCSCDRLDEASVSNPAVRSFSANVTRRASIANERLIKQAQHAATADADPLIPDVAHYCKNPKHKPSKKFWPRGYCLTCKNPRHRHGLPGATLLLLSSEREKYALPCSDKDVHCRQSRKHRRSSEITVETEKKETAKNETRAPAISVKMHRKGPVRKSEPTTCCCLSIAVCTAVVTLALVYLFFIDFQEPPEPNTTTLPPAGVYYCSTDFCNREAARIKSLLSSTAGPCDDFYQHVCDKWVRSQRLQSPGTGTAISSDTMIQDKLIGDLAADLDEHANVALELYNSCTDPTQSGRALAAMHDLFREWTIRRWPTDALETTRGVWSFAGELIKDVGLNALVDVHVAVDSDNPTKFAIGLKKPSFLFSCNDATRPAVLNMLQDALLETMAATGRPVNPQLVDEIMQVVARFSSSPSEPPVSEASMRGFSVVRLSDMNPGITDLLRATFGNDSTIDQETKVVLKSADFLQGHLIAALRELPPRAVMNYLGFLVFINLAPFFLDRHRLLRQLFSKSVLGRTLPDVSNTGHLCLVAVERVLPGCFANISSQYLRDPAGIVANKLSQLVASFGRSVEHLSWMNDMGAVMSRYLLKEFATVPSSNDSTFCPASSTSHARDSSVKFFVAVSRDRKRRMLRPLTKSDADEMAPDSRSQLLTTATYDAPSRRLHVPAALFNASVPVNTSHFSLHFSRFAVRFYRAVVEALLHKDAVQPSLRYDEDLQRRFEDLLACFEWELRQLPGGLSHSAVAPHSVTARGAFLQQTVAVQLAFRAFQELLQIRRTWNMDFRFAQLPGLSVDQLFFVYYALDNCEAADAVYQEHHWLPARYRVNVPLRNVVEFAELFKCPPDSDMVRVSFVPRCTVVAIDRWDRSRPAGY